LLKVSQSTVLALLNASSCNAYLDMAAFCLLFLYLAAFLDI